MDEKHKRWIRSHFVEILKSTNLDILLKHVKRKNIFPEILLEKYELPTLTPHERKRQFYWDIQKRGPKAYDLLLEACQESGQHDLYTILSTEPSQNTIKNVNVTQEDIEKHAVPFFHSVLNNDDKYSKDSLIKTMEKNADTATMSLNMDRRLIKVIPSEFFMDDSKGIDHKSLIPYRMRGHKRGVAFIINNIKFVGDNYELRNGADVDGRNLKELFTQFGFECKNFYWEDQTCVGFENKLRDFVKNPILGEVDSCFVLIMSHGVEGSIPEDTHIITHDNSYYKASDIINKFSNRSCPLLRHKPKVIIFQACRGGMQDFGVTQSATTNKSQHSTTPTDSINVVPQMNKHTEIDGESKETMSVMSDLLVCYSSCPGYKSYRDKYLGAWFIQHFCEIFMDHAWNTDVRRMFDMISHTVSEERTTHDARQTAYIATYKFRPCYLNPKLYVNTSS